MEESTVPAASVETKIKETSNSTEDHISNAYRKNDVTLVKTFTKHRNIVSLSENQTEDEKNSSRMVTIGKEFAADSSSDKEENRADFKAGGNEVTLLPASVDQSFQDLQDQEEELRELGINVVDQLSLERHVEAAVSRILLQLLIKHFRIGVCWSHNFGKKMFF